MSMDARRQLSVLRVQELKALCKEQGLNFNGTKAELLDRLVNQCTEQEATKKPPTPPRKQRAAVPPAADEDEAPLSLLVPTPQRQRNAGGRPKVSKETAKLKDDLRAVSTEGRGRGSSRGRGRGGRGASARLRSALLQAPSGPDLEDAEDTAPLLLTGRSTASASSASSLRCRCCGSASGLAKHRYCHAPETFSCAECRLKAMDPLNDVEPGGLLKVEKLSKLPRLDFTLELPSLKQWRKDGLNVDVRMIRLGAAKLLQAWPHSLQVVANDKELFAVQPPEDGHKRRDVPQSISSGLVTGKNKMTVRAKDDDISDFVLAILLTRPRTMADLKRQVSRCSIREATMRIRKLVGNAGQAGGGEITCLSSNLLRLSCPIGMDRIADSPARGSMCEHLQCFSLEAYLRMNSQMAAFNNRWQCPICSLVLRPADLCVDDYVANALSSTPSDVDEVVVDADGSWRRAGKPPRPGSVVGSKVEAETIDTPKGPSRKRSKPLAATDSVTAGTFKKLLRLSAEPAGPREVLPTSPDKQGAETIDIDD
eukprot:TRINITY_DN47531_c0_g1_i1.p1 TRINITY_DN47531_c0_g1~~TRINITY_DN47531_c0_g1_i1.p1  ORF type:complete len:538 (+),score=104.56 TRINITY_DN47531_c0_g1_i1:98-1711(+)